MMLARARVFGRRGLTRSMHSFPSGQSEGGHKVVEKNIFQRMSWKDLRASTHREVWPLIAAVAFGCGVGVYKLSHWESHSKGPWATLFGAHNREILGIKPSDDQLEYKD